MLILQTKRKSEKKRYDKKTYMAKINSRKCRERILDFIKNWTNFTGKSNLNYTVQ